MAPLPLVASSRLGPERLCLGENQPGRDRAEAPLRGHSDMLLSMTATARLGLTAPVSRGRRPRTITVRKLPHRTTHGYLMMLREKHPGFTFSHYHRRRSPSGARSCSGLHKARGWCGAGAVVGRSCVAGIIGAGAGVVAGAEATPGARLLAGGEAAEGEDAGRALHPADYPRLTTPELLMVLGPGSWGRGSCWGL